LQYLTKNWERAQRSMSVRRLLEGGKEGACLRQVILNGQGLLELRLGFGSPLGGRPKSRRRWSGRLRTAPDVAPLVSETPEFTDVS
jgi:hypothetical protein